MISLGAKRVPPASRPYMPGYDMMFRRNRSNLSWAWASHQLSKAHNYFLSTVRSNGKPHVMPVWGVWLDNTFCFSTGRQSRKSQNLSRNPHCVVCPETATKAVVLEGTAREVLEGSSLGRFLAAYKKKYGWDMSDTKDPIYQVNPRVVFGIAENSEGNPTRWRFNNRR